MPEENEFTNPASSATEDSEAVLALQEIASEESDVEAHVMAVSSASGGLACDHSCSGSTLSS